MAVHKLRQPFESTAKITYFKELIFELATRLIRGAPEEMDPEIDRTLRVAGPFWGFNRLMLTRLSEMADRLDIAYAYAVTGHAPEPSAIFIGENHWIVPRLKNNQPIILTEAAGETATESTLTPELFDKIGAPPLLLFPVITDDKLWGVLSACPSKWDPVLDAPAVEVLEAFCSLLASAIQKRRTLHHVITLLKFDHLLSEISATYINLPVEQVEKMIRNDLGRLGELLGADRCLLYLLDEEKDNFVTCTDMFTWWPGRDNAAVAHHNSAIAEYHKSAADFEAVHFAWAFDKWRKGQSIQLTHLDAYPPEAAAFKQASIHFGVKSHLSVPVSFNQKTVGALVMLTTRTHRNWHNDLIQRVRLFGEVFANALMRKRADQKLRNAFSEIKQLKDRIEADYIYLRDETEQNYARTGMIGQSAAMKNILVQIRQVAPTDTTVLILGETGTGKGVTARAIHRASARGRRPLIQVNCAALSPSLIESELFGHERGAFTGADNRREGRFERADGTSLFLDEIGELPLELQAKLLRVLENGEFERVGGSTTHTTDVRIIAATNRDLEAEVEAGRFRRDLWYRLSIFPIFVPPLRERVDDIPLFVKCFAEKYGSQKGKHFDIIPQDNIRLLKKYHWPGNIRELENLVERAVITSQGGQLHIDPPAGGPWRTTDRNRSMQDVARDHIVKTLQECAWKIEGLGGAAARLELNPATLRSRMKKLGIIRPQASHQ